jgi:hypothetical protein
MSAQLPCPWCEADRSCMLRQYSETVTIRGAEVEYQAWRWWCRTCGEIFDTPETMDRNLTVARGVRSTMP